jgi:predicted neuraminidase
VTATRARRTTLVVLAALLHPPIALGQARLAVVRSELVFQSAPFATAHASTIAESSGGLVAAWFAGPFEGAPGAIWVSRLSGGRWTPPAGSSERRTAGWHPTSLLEPGALSAA